LWNIDGISCTQTARVAYTATAAAVHPGMFDVSPIDVSFFNNATFGTFEDRKRSAAASVLHSSA
jgi:hypothetical protein